MDLKDPWLNENFINVTLIVVLQVISMHVFKFFTLKKLKKFKRGEVLKTTIVSIVGYNSIHSYKKV